MKLKPKLEFEGLGIFLTGIYFAVVGILECAILVYEDWPPHVGFLAVLSLVAAFGLLTVKKWAVWLVVALLPVSTVFGAITLYITIAIYTRYQSTEMLLFLAGFILFLALTWIASAYVATKREKFQ